MTIDEAIKLVKIERECVIRADHCDRKCEKCDLVQDANIIIDMYEHVEIWLEELKALRHEANEWRKAGYAHGHSDGYNNGIDDFVNACKENIFCKTFGLRKVDIEQIAEQLKAGGKNEQS